MTTHLQSILKKFGWVLLAVILAVLLLISPARADDTLPPETDTEAAVAEETPPAEESAVLPEEPEIGEGEAPPVETAEATEEAPPAEDILLPTDVLPIKEDEETPSADGLAEVIEAVSESGLEIVDGSGEALTMTDASTEELLSDGDPWFKVGTTIYSFTTTDCNPDIIGNQGCVDPLQKAIDYIRINGTLPTDRMIYMESGSYLGATIDGNNFPVLGQLKGLIGEYGSGATTLTTGLTVLSPLTGFTVRGFKINGVLTITMATGTVLLEDLDVKNGTGTGITVTTTGSVELKGVESSNNTGKGAWIVSGGSAYSVKISNSEFDDNNPGYNAPSLYIYSEGAVTLDGVSASRNRGDGFYTDSFKSLTVKNSVFDDNYASPDSAIVGYGIYATNANPCTITLSNVIANTNENDNIYLDVNGNVTAANIETRWSGTGDGFHVNSSTSTLPKTVTITNGFFDTNSNDGLKINALGTVTLKNIIATNNINGNGADIDNCIDSGGGVCLGNGNVVLAGVLLGDRINDFSSNSLEGLKILSHGSITLTNLDANLNNWSGLSITNDYAGATGGVTINTNLVGSWVNTFGHNNGNGIEIHSNGNIMVSDATADANVIGFLLENTSGVKKSVQVIRSSANENSYEGLQVLASGFVTLLNNSTFNENGFGGDFSGANIYSIAGNISITGTSTEEPTDFSLNSGYGLAIFADNGSVTLKRVRANENNGAYGIDINNIAVPGKTVSIFNSSFSHNNQNGLRVNSRGGITLDTVDGAYNGNTGANLDNCQEAAGECTGGGNVIVTAKANYTNWFNENGFNGLEIFSKGTISLTNVNADYNMDNYGAYLFNRYIGATGGVTVKATNDQFSSFSYYELVGLYAESNGPISLSRVTACSNFTNGALLINVTAPTPKTVTVSNSIFNYNEDDGLLVSASGAITINGVQANQNSLNQGLLNESGHTLYEFKGMDKIGEDEFHYYNNDYWYFDGIAGHSVTITMASDFLIPRISVYNSTLGYVVQDNNNSNLSSLTVTFTTTLNEKYYIYTYSNNGTSGPFSLALNDPTNSNPFDPQVSGMRLTSTNGGVTIVNSKAMGFGAEALNNSYDGIHIEAAGVVKMANVIGGLNGRRGLSVDNRSASSNAPVTLANAALDENFVVGALVESNGAASWTNGSANGNQSEGGAGFLVGTANAVNITNVDLNDSIGTPGLFVTTMGSVTLTNVNASNTAGAAGIMIMNDGGTAPVTVKASGTGRICEISGNGDTGMKIYTRGAVTLSGISANWNVGNGVMVDGSGSLAFPTVKVSNSAFNNNSADGLVVLAKGGITLTNVDASGNSLQNEWLDVASHGQTRFEHIGYYNEADLWWFHYTTGNPIKIEVDSIQFSPSIIIHYSDGWNYYTGSAGGGSHVEYTFNPGYDDDFYVEVLGGEGRYDISLNDTPNAYPGSGYAAINGIVLDNCLGGVCQGTGSITIGGTTDNEFHGNNWNGMDIKTQGAVSITNASASTNGYQGAQITNNEGTSTVLVTNTLKGGLSHFNNNHDGYGLAIYSRGTITLKNLTASNNLSTGAYIYNQNMDHTAGLTISKAYFNNNIDVGLYANTNGAISLNNTNATGNLNNGITLINNNAVANQPVTVKKTSVNGNTWVGLMVSSRGLITVDGITALENGDQGLYLDNEIAGATAGVTISGVTGENRFAYNSVGVMVFSNGAISATRVNAYWNSGYGMFLYNMLGSGKISVSNSSLTYNANTGLFTNASGAISISGVSCLRNGYSFNADGMYLQTGAFPVTIKNSTAIGNWGSGIEISLHAPYWPTISNTSYMGNEVDGGTDLNLKITQIP